MSLLICSTSYDGCGFIGHSDEFVKSGESLMDRHIDDADLTICPECNKDHVFGLTLDNFASLTDESNRELAERILTNHEDVVAKANCGCWYAAEEGTACPHDIHEARKRLRKVAA